MRHYSVPRRSCANLLRYTEQDCAGRMQHSGALANGPVEVCGYFV